MLFAARTVAGEVWSVVAVVGEIDLATAPRFRSELVAAADRAVVDGVGLAVDLGSCDFIDSIGLGVVLGGFRRMRSAGRPFAVVVSESRVRDLFVRCRLDEILDLYGVGGLPSTIPASGQP